MTAPSFGKATKAGMIEDTMAKHPSRTEPKRAADDASEGWKRFRAQFNAATIAAFATAILSRLARSSAICHASRAPPLGRQSGLLTGFGPPRVAAADAQSEPRPLCGLSGAYAMRAAPALGAKRSLFPPFLQCLFLPHESSGRPQTFQALAAFAHRDLLFVFVLMPPVGVRRRSRRRVRTGQDASWSQSNHLCTSYVLNVFIVLNDIGSACRADFYRQCTKSFRSGSFGTKAGALAGLFGGQSCSHD